MSELAKLTMGRNYSNAERSRRENRKRTSRPCSHGTKIDRDTALLECSFLAAMPLFKSGGPARIVTATLDEQAEQFCGKPRKRGEAVPLLRHKIPTRYCCESACVNCNFLEAILFVGNWERSPTSLLAWRRRGSASETVEPQI